MKKITATLLSLLVNFSILPCSDFYLHQLKEKQFADDAVFYDWQNSRHRGWRQYLSQSLYGSRNIVLTFDDGPHPTNTPRLLDLLKKYQVKATFFVVTDRVKKYPKIAKRIVSEGHTLASHSKSHLNSNSESEAQYYKGLKESLVIVKNYYNQPETYYRFPFGAYGKGKGGYHHLNSIKKLGQDLFGENCINFAFWDIDTSDWVSEMKPNDIVQTIRAHLDGGKAYRFKLRNGKYVKDPYQIRTPPNGGVILMHDIHKRTVDAVEKLLPKLKQWSAKVIELKDVDEFSFGSKACELTSLI